MAPLAVVREKSDNGRLRQGDQKRPVGFPPNCCRPHYKRYLALRPWVQTGSFNKSRLDQSAFRGLTGWLGFSDGTLLIGTYNETLECGWEVAREGAGLLRVAGDLVVLEGYAEWVTVSVYDANVVKPPLPHDLPLFPDLDRWAA